MWTKVYVGANKIEYWHLQQIYTEHFIQQKQNTHSSQVHKKHSPGWINHMIGHKTSLSRFKNIEANEVIFCNHYGIKLEINNKRKAGIFTNMWKLEIKFLNNKWVRKKIKRQIQKYLNKWKWKQSFMAVQVVPPSTSNLRTH